METCKYCEELNEEKEDIEIEEIYLKHSGHFGYRCPVKHCPACGIILDKYKSV